MSVRTIAIAGISIAIGMLFQTARPSARSLVWNSALLACLVAPLAWSVAPPVTVFVPARLLPAAATAATGVRPAPASVAIINARETQGARLPRDLSAGGSGRLLLYLWLSGIVFFGIRFGRQLLCAHRLARRATRVDHPRLAALLTAARYSLRIRHEVPVLQSSQIDIPLATGILHPVILLPASAAEWTEDELRIVLLHELAHVRRADIAARAVAMIACAIHWFNPLVWVLGRLSTRDAELAADDLVLRAGVRPSTYADALLNLAGSMFHFPAAQPAMPLARRGGLADRVHAILHVTDRRTDIGRLTRITVIGGSCVVGILAGCVRFAPAATTTLMSVPGKPVGRIALPLGNPSSAMRIAINDSSWIDGATDGLIHALSDASPQVRGGAAHSLGRLRPERARAALLALADDPDKYVRYEVDQALAALDRTN
jgi:beta-lactamase regulating signal transducer with metallopeptidase domain